MNHNRTVSGVNIGHLWGQVGTLREELQAVLALWEQGTVKPRIDTTYPFADAATAHRRILQRQNTGKVVLVP
jgi:NADPH:quinone reductase-like Zn-dependent oxidoreductase